MPKELTYLSLFSGCGGFDIGFVAEGFKCAGAFDIDLTVLGNLERYLRVPVHQVDLSTGSLPESLSRRVDVVVAGPPCQGFSTAGLRKLDDPRNALLLNAGKICLQDR